MGMLKKVKDKDKAQKVRSPKRKQYEKMYRQGLWTAQMLDVAVSRGMLSSVERDEIING